MLRNAFFFILGAYFLILCKQLCVHFVICSVALNAGRLKLHASLIKQIISLLMRGLKSKLMKLISFKSLLNKLRHLLCEKVQNPRLVGLSLCSGHCFCTWKDDICERPGLKFTNSIWRRISTLRRCEAIVRSFCGLLKGYWLRQLKPKKGTLQKQLTVNSLPSSLLKKSFFYLHFKDQMIDWFKHFDSRNTYLWHPWQVLRVTGSTENPEIYFLIHNCSQNQHVYY